MERSPLANSAPTSAVFVPSLDPTDALPLGPDMLRFWKVLVLPLPAVTVLLLTVIVPVVRRPAVTSEDVQESDVPEDALPQVFPVPPITTLTDPAWLAMALEPVLVP